MPDDPQPVSEAELDVLKAIWDGGPGTVAAIRERLQTLGFDWAYTTVQTLLYRLQEKGYVSRQKEGRAHVFDATVSRREHLRLRLSELRERVCEGSTTPLVLALVEQGEFTAEEVEYFRDLLDRLDAGDGSAEAEEAER